ncbi:MAG: HAD family acid phosphatase [Kiritimatiellae bacterium]|nr:HAD family acid phosphatase [Kiritimatiellia bacterium]MDD4737252.1 HAD family acid phosphatase [Kiritimatiellia bacterium]
MKNRFNVKAGLFLAVCALLLSGCASTRVEPANLGLLKNEIKDYYSDGDYEKEAARIGGEALARLKACPDKAHAAIVLDIDDTSLSTYQQVLAADFAYEPTVWNAWASQAVAPAIEPTLALVNQALAQDTAVFFITGRAENLREITEKNLLHAGYTNWTSLIMKPDGDKRSADAYKTAERKKITEMGHTIVVNMGDQESDLAGGYAEYTFKLPNPCYFIP